MTVNGPVNNQGRLEARSSATLTGALTTVGGSRLVVGTSVSNTLTVASGFTNNGVIELANTSSSSFTQLTITAGALVNASGAAIETTGVSSSPSLRSINADLEHRGAMTLNTEMTVNGRLTIPAGFSATVTGVGDALFVTGFDIDGATFDNVPLVSTGGTIVDFDNVTFQSMDVTSATQLTISNSGAGGPFTFYSVVFDQPVTGSGLYVSATETGGLPILTITFTNATPSDGTAGEQELGGAIVSWVP